MLSPHEWREVIAAVGKDAELGPSDALIRALAFFELGRIEEASVDFIYAALSGPRTVAIVLGFRSDSLSSESFVQVHDHNEGVELRASITEYLATQSTKSKRFARELWRAPKLTALRTEIATLEHAWAASGIADDVTSMRSAKKSTLPLARVGWTHLGTNRPRRAATSRGGDFERS